MNENKTVEVSESLFKSIRSIIKDGARFISTAANATLVKMNWEIGRLIVEDEQKGRRKAEYGKAVLKDLSERLMKEFGDGYTERNLRYMRSFYLSFPIWNALRSELGWTHYRILMREQDPVAREWYMNECVACGWSSRNLEKVRNSMLPDDFTFEAWAPYFEIQDSASSENRHLPSDELASNNFAKTLPIVQLTVQGYSQPIGIATYQALKKIPEPYKALAPVIDGVRRLWVEHNATAKKSPKKPRGKSCGAQW